MLWTEKYRPEKLSEIVGQEHFTMDAETWIEENNMPNVLMYGNAGLGKTAAAVALAKSLLGDNFKDNFYELNASDDRRLETVRTTIKEVAQSKTLGGSAFRILLLDEMGGMTKDAQNSLKRIMERYADNIRFIITCNDRNKIIYPLQSRCANYRFRPLSNEAMIEVLQSIIQREGLRSFSDDELLSFIYDLNGDMRRAITELQAAKASNYTLPKQIEESNKEYTNIMQMIIERNSNKALTTLHQMLYDGRSVKEICNGMHNTLLNMEGLEIGMKFKFLRVIGETEWRSPTMTPRVILSWMVGQLI